MKYKAVICDWNGTLINDLSLCYKSIIYIFDQYGIPAPSLKTYRDEIGADYMRFYWKHGIPEQIPVDTLNRLRHEFLSAHWDDAKLHYGAKKLFTLFREQKFITILMTGEVGSIVHKRLAQFNIENCFDIVNADARDRKTSFQGLRVCFNINNKSTLYIDDGADNLRIAKQIGLTTVGLTHGYHTKQRIMEADPHFIADNLHDVQEILKQ